MSTGEVNGFFCKVANLTKLLLLLGSLEKTLNGDKNFFHFFSNNYINAKIAFNNYPKLGLEDIYAFATNTQLPLPTILKKYHRIHFLAKIN